VAKALGTGRAGDFSGKWEVGGTGGATPRAPPRRRWPSGREKSSGPPGAVGFVFSLTHTDTTAGSGGAAAMTRCLRARSRLRGGGRLRAGGTRAAIEQQGACRRPTLMERAGIGWRGSTGTTRRGGRVHFGGSVIGKGKQKRRAKAWLGRRDRARGRQGQWTSFSVAPLEDLREAKRPGQPLEGGLAPAAGAAGV